MLLVPAAPSRIPPAECGRFHSLRYRIEMVQVSYLRLSIPYTSAEIPPAGAPSGFDFAAIVGFAFAVAPLCRSAQNDTEMWRSVGCNRLVAMLL